MVTADAMHAQTTWRPIEGTITTTETSTPYDLVRITSYLTDDAEEAQGHYGVRGVSRTGGVFLPVSR